MNSNTLIKERFSESDILVKRENNYNTKKSSFSASQTQLHVTRAYIPEQRKIRHYLDSAFSSKRLSNRGPLEQLLTARLQEYLEVENLLVVSNGTLALQIAQKALTSRISNANVITTPFSFIATASSLLWEGIEPRFADINSSSLCIDPASIESLIDANTQALLPVHVFGHPCDVSAIDKIARKHKLKTIYDGAQAFGVRFKNKSIFKYGDATTLSFHATKLFHTAEGGAIIFKDKNAFDIAKELASFGYGNSGEIERIGINAKLSEVHAAIGLAVLEDIDYILEQRASIWNQYYNVFSQHFDIPTPDSDTLQNYSYFPVILNNENSRRQLSELCESENIYPRRYFYPSLNTLDFMPEANYCPVSESISERILCLPLSPDMTKYEQVKVINTVLRLTKP